MNAYSTSPSAPVIRVTSPFIQFTTKANTVNRSQTTASTMNATKNTGFAIIRNLSFLLLFLSDINTSAYVTL